MNSNCSYFIIKYFDEKWHKTCYCYNACYCYDKNKTKDVVLDYWSKYETSSGCIIEEIKEIPEEDREQFIKYVNKQKTLTLTYKNKYVMKYFNN